jgi:prepilin-type processing-associated H-X9-DG protein
LHFRVCAEELGTPKILVCPADKSKQPLEALLNTGTAYAALSGERTPGSASAGAQSAAPANAAISKWANLDGASHISYFVGKTADETKPGTLLTGDAGLNDSNTINSNSSGDATWYDAAGTSIMVEFDVKFHGDAGNIALADGSVQQVTTMGLRELIMSALASGSGTNSNPNSMRQVTISLPRGPM